MSRETELQTFKGALESMIESFSTLTGIQLKGSIDAEAADSLNRAHSAEVLQIVREAVSNSIRHAQAEEITVSVRPDNGRVSIVVADDGKGFDPHAPTSGGYGMANMQARAEALGGAIHIESSSDTGTRIRVELPKQA
jgi:signal transduction histidine kinase